LGFGLLFVYATFDDAGNLSIDALNLEVIGGELGLVETRNWGEEGGEGGWAWRDLKVDRNTQENY